MTLYLVCTVLNCVCHNPRINSYLLYTVLVPPFISFFLSFSSHRLIGVATGSLTCPNLVRNWPLCLYATLLLRHLQVPSSVLSISETNWPQAWKLGNFSIAIQLSKYCSVKTTVQGEGWEVPKFRCCDIFDTEKQGSGVVLSRFPINANRDSWFI